MENIDKLNLPSNQTLNEQFLKACLAQDLKQIQYFLDCGADVNYSENLSVKTAISKKNVAMMEMLYKNPDLNISNNFSLLLDICKYGTIETVPIFFSKANDFQNVDFPLHACRENNEDMVNFLIARGEDVLDLNKTILLTITSSTAQQKPTFPALQILLKKYIEDIAFKDIQVMLECREYQLAHWLITEMGNPLDMYDKTFCWAIEQIDKRAIEYFAPLYPQELLNAAPKAPQLLVKRSNQLEVVMMHSWLESFCIPFKERQELNGCIKEKQSDNLSIKDKI